MFMYILCESDSNNYSGAGHVTLAGASHVTINLWRKRHRSCTCMAAPRAEVTSASLKKTDICRIESSSYITLCQSFCLNHKCGTLLFVLNFIYVHVHVLMTCWFRQKNINLLTFLMTKPMCSCLWLCSAPNNEKRICLKQRNTKHYMFIIPSSFRRVRLFCMTSNMITTNSSPPTLPATPPAMAAVWLDVPPGLSAENGTGHS